MEYWQKYCDESTLHGFHELFYAKTKTAKTFWSLIILVGSLLTAYQIYQVVNTFYSNPTKTQITIFPPSATPRYPPFVFTTPHFSQWVNLTKVKLMTLDPDTFLYAMSHFNRIYTRQRFNVTESNEKLKSIMQKFRINNMYDLAVELSSRLPANLNSTATFRPFLSTGGLMLYISVMDETFFNHSDFRASHLHNIQLTSFTNFETSEFDKEFRRLFDNRSLADEFALYKLLYVLCDNADEESIHSSLSYQFSPVGKENAFVYVNVLLADYEFYIKATLYKWIPLPERPCIDNGESYFYADCDYRCLSVYKLFKHKKCSVYFVDKTAAYQYPLDNVNNSCIYDESMVNSSRLYFPNDSYQRCLTECLSMCYQWSYEFNQVLYPKHRADKNRRVNGVVTLTYDTKDSILVVSLLPSFTWEDALASIGGLLGLWLGGSIISFVHIFYLFCWVPLESRFWNRHTLTGQHQPPMLDTLKKVVEIETEIKLAKLSNNVQEHVTNLKNEIKEIKAVKS